MIQRSGEVRIWMLENVQQVTIKPLILGAIAAGTLIFTYARDEDGDGFCEVHSNTMEGFWSLLRPWLRPHRGISQDKLPLYLELF
jgi:transposase-like protein